MVSESKGEKIVNREIVELCAEQDTFNSLVDSLNLADVVCLLQDLGVDDAKLRGAVYGWALNEAGL